jgi:hypothetical protein
MGRMGRCQTWHTLNLTSTCVLLDAQGFFVWLLALSMRCPCDSVYLFGRLLARRLAGRLPVRLSVQRDLSVHPSRSVSQSACPPFLICPSIHSAVNPFSGSRSDKRTFRRTDIETGTNESAAAPSTRRCLCAARQRFCPSSHPWDSSSI